MWLRAYKQRGQCICQHDLDRNAFEEKLIFPMPFKTSRLVMGGILITLLEQPGRISVRGNLNYVHRYDIQDRRLNHALTSLMFRMLSSEAVI